MAASVRVVSHVRRTAEARYPPFRHGRGIGRAVELQGRADEHIDGVLARHLAKRAVRAHGAVDAGEEYVGPCGDIVFHAQFPAEAVDGFDPARFDGGNQGRMRIQRPVLADFPFQAELFAIGRQQQFDGGGVESDAVVERLHLMPCIDALDGHHRHEDMNRFDEARVAGEQRFDEKRLVGRYDEIDP